jgi:MFS transporter, DHA1 family, multidrug resistance protein
MGFKEFITLIAAIMSVNALAIDVMLPALPAIGEALQVATENQRQWVVTAYLLGFGGAQLIYGPLADRYGRRPVLLAGLGMYAVFGVLAAFAHSFDLLLLARLAQGIGAAATRVLAVSIVRDCYSGEQMARVMSLTFLVFLAVPIAAPSIGQLILLVAPWRWIFGVLGLFGLTILLWSALRMPETLHEEDRMPVEVGRIAAAVRQSLTERMAVGYMLAMTVMLGSLFGFINSVQQLFADVFHAPDVFPAIFGMVAGFMAVSSLLNARIVSRLGMRRVSHTALLGYVSVAVLHALLALTGHESIWSFSVLQCAMMFCFGMVVSNFGAMAMQPLGHVAGTASSVQGFVTTVGGAVLGFMIGQRFDGSAVPMTLGFALCGIAALLIVVATERGRLFAGVAAPAVAAREA